MSAYAIVICSRCGGYLLAKIGQKTRTCPYCGLKMPLEKVQRIAIAKTANEASSMLRMIKEKRFRLQKQL
jgi:DNA-directed RNA polymerase subunit RPC12/RpoP